MADLKPPRLARGEAETLHALLQYQRESLARKVAGVDAVAFAGADLDELCRRPDPGPPVSLRWVLMHLLEETGRHADILRELIDGSTGRLPPPCRPALA